MSNPKDVHVLIPGTYKYAALGGKRDFADTIKVKVLRWEEYPGLTKWAQCNHKGFHKKETGDQSERQSWESGNRSGSDVGPRPKDLSQPLEAGKGQEVVLSQSLQKELSCMFFSPLGMT